MKPSKLFYGAVIILLSISQVLIGQDTKNVSRLSNFGQGEGESLGVFAAGAIVYYGLGAKVVIESFSNPAAPLKISSIDLTDVIQSLVRTSINSTQYLVVSGGSKVWLINVQDPTKPSIASMIDVGGGTTCEGVATSGSYAYVAAGDAGFKVYSISTPTAPVLVASIDSLAYCENVVISSPYAYIAAGSRSHIVDISNPAAPVYAGRITGYGGYHQYINVRGGYAYVCNYDAGLQVVNVANPASPVNVLNIPSIPRIGCIVFDGNYGYVAAGDSGLKIFNLVNPAAPALVSQIATTGRAAFVSYGAITIGGSPKGHIFVSNRATASGMSAINVSDPAAPTLSAYVGAASPASGTAYAPFYANGKVYVAYGTAGLRILDVSNPAAVAALSTTALGGDSRGVVASGNYVYVAARDSGLFVVDATNASSPVKLKTLKITRANGVAISGNYLYVAAADSGLGIVNITNPASPSVTLYTHPGAQYGENVAVAGGVVGLTDYDKILFFDVASPTAPVAKGLTPSFTTGDEGFAIAGNYAYVPDGDSLKIFSIANLLKPAMVSSIKTGGYGYMAAVAGNYCYVASEATGVRAINISNPSTPMEDGHYDGVPQSRGITANGKYIYVAEKIDGLSVYSNDLLTSVENHNGMVPEVTTLHQNFPNPFNPSTKISFDLHAATHVKLEVLNVLGQSVAVLLNDDRNAGTYNIEFNAQHLSSGAYFYRLTTGEAVSLKRMILMK